jgi:hypothetical protein
MTTRTNPRRTQPPRRTLRQLVHSDAAAITAAGVFALSFASTFMREPDRVEGVSVTNPTDYDIAVQVRGGHDDGWMPLSTAMRHDTTTVFDVIDQGDTWTFKLRAQGRDGGEYRIDRDDLEAAGWTIELPDEVATTLRDAGAPLPP